MMMMMRRKWLWIGAGVALVVGLGLSSMFKSVTVDTAAVKKTDVAFTVTEKGKVTSRDSGDMVSEVTGKVKAVYVNPGDSVKKGQLMAEIDDSELAAQIAQLEGQLQAVTGQEKTAQGGPNQVREKQLALDQAITSLNLAKKNYERSRTLFAQGAITQADLDQAKSDLDIKDKSVAQARAALKSAQAQSSGDKMQYTGQKASITAQLDRLRDLRSKARVVAPADDTVLGKNINGGDMVTPGTVLFTLGSTHKMIIEAYVSSQDTGSLAVRDKTTVIFRRLGHEVPASAVITRIAPVAETRVSALGVEEDKIKITLESLANPKGVTVVPGVSVDVVLTAEKAAGVLAVPKDAVFKDQGKQFVWVSDDGEAKLVQVVCGLEGDDLTEVKKGLQAGQIVVADPNIEGLKEGIKIKSAQ